MRSTLLVSDLNLLGTIDLTVTTATDTLAELTTNQLPELRTKKFWQQMPLLKLLWSVKK